MVLFEYETEESQKKVVESLESLEFFLDFELIWPITSQGEKLFCIMFLIIYTIYKKHANNQVMKVFAIYIIFF